ncbi:MAG: serine/threonine-protein kinase [Acidobacteriota bacterium]
MSATEDRWQRIDDLFDAALDLPRGERGPFLDKACGGDNGLRAAVERLLSHADTSASLGAGAALETGGAFDLVDDLAESEGPALATGERVGPWRVVRELGRGGMAVVYEAERADGGFHQRSALKIVRPGSGHDALMARFARERQILASLQHPAIAQLLDGGTTADGRPYFAMELIDGEPLDHFCDRGRLTVAQRLDLFITVGRAVEAAHRSLVIHRDLKPSNILVTRDGRIKLLDFGIAKPIAGDLSEAPAAIFGNDPGARRRAEPPALTAPSMRVLTPEYASPEQLLGEAVTTASDLYQLGVLLYELLTGRRPYGGNGGSPIRLARAICDQRPTPPSEAVWTSAGTSSGDAARNRGGSSRRQLRRLLRGDLDSVVMKALRKEPGERYGSVAQMLDDLERYLTDRPLAARQAGVLYRTGKMVRRHTVAVTAGVAAVALSVALVIFYTLRLADERDRAQRIAGFLTGVLEVADPWAVGGDELTARQLLDHGTAQIEGKLAGDPATAAAVTHLFGTAYRKLGDLERGHELLESALAQRRDLLGLEHPDVAETEYQLGRSHLGFSRYDEARELLDHAESVQRRRLGDRHPALAATLLSQGILLRNYRRNGEALAVQRQALDILESIHPADSEALVRPLSILAITFDSMQDFEGSADLRRRVVSILETTLGPDHPRVALAVGQLARSLGFAGDGEAALPLFERALAVFEGSFTQDPPLAQANLMTHFALVVDGNGDHRRAVELQGRALEITAKAFGPTNPATLIQVHDYGIYLARAGRPAEGVAHLERSLGALELAMGADSPHMAEPLLDLAEAVWATGDLRRARRLGERVAALLRVMEGDQGIRSLSASRTRLAEFYDGIGETQAAEALRSEAVGGAEAP